MTRNQIMRDPNPGKLIPVVLLFGIAWVTGCPGPRGSGNDDDVVSDGGNVIDAGDHPGDASSQSTRDASIQSARDASAVTDGGPVTSCVDLDRDDVCHDVDCDDLSESISPLQSEVCGNGMDDDCNRQVDEGCLDSTVRFYVDRDSLGGTCSDSNPGTINQPWCTLAKANQSLTAGQTVFIRAGMYNETIQPAHSGSSDNARITYSRYADEDVTLTGSVYCIRLQSRSYIAVLGIGFMDCGRNVYIQASHHNNIGFCTFDNPGGPATWAGSRIYEGSTYNRIFGCVFTRYGRESQSSGGFDDSGCILDIGNDNTVDRSDYNLVVGNQFSLGGHHILGVYSNRNIIRGNTFHNEEWYACHRTESGGLCGNRNVILNTSNPNENIRNVIEGNHIVFSGVPPDQDSSAGLSVRTQHNIIRHNVFYHNDTSGVALSADGSNSNNASYNHVYSNVFFHNGFPLVNDWDPMKSGMLLARWVDDAAHNAMTGVAIKNNIFHDNNLHAVYFYYVNPQEQDAAGNHDGQEDPRFMAANTVPDPANFNVLDLHLQASSPCIDNGVFLTVTTSAGQDSTALVVQDVGYFSDGHGLVDGDVIQLEGQTHTAKVVAVDHATTTITLDQPLTWTSGTGVGLPYMGRGPDQGAYEHGL